MCTDHWSSFIPVSPVAESEFDFPPPPSELELNSGHTKQLSEASLLSDASTVKQRRSPSLDDYDDAGRVAITAQRADNYECWNRPSKDSSCEEQFRDLSVVGR